MTYRGDNPEDYYPYYDDTRPYELKTNKEEYDYSKLARLIRIINQAPDSLEMVLSIKETLQYFAVNILTGSWDDYRFLRNNFYLYHNPSDDLIHWIPYDYDNSFIVLCCCHGSIVPRIQLIVPFGIVKTCIYIKF